jgi:hypothetical protein
MKGYCVENCVNETESLFNAKEFGVSLTTTKVLDQNYEANLNVGLSYSLTKNFLVDAEVPVYQKDSVAIDSLSFGITYRYPVLTYVAPYASVGTRYEWNDGNWDGYCRVGIEGRISRKWSVFTDASYNFGDFNSFNDGNWSVRGGIRLIL